MPPSEGCRLPSCPASSSSFLLTLWGSTRIARALRSTGITPLHHYYGAVRPWPAHRYFSLAGLPLAPFPFASPVRFSSSARKPGLGCRVKDWRGADALTSVRFQPLPIRTAREVFPQAAHPASFIERVMGLCRSAAATFTRSFARWVMGGFSNPSIAQASRRDTCYSIVATRHSSFVAVCAELRGFGFSSPRNHALH